MQGGLEPITADTGRGQGTPWTCSQFIARLTYRDKQPFTLTFKPTGSLESPINLTCMSLNCGKKPEYQEEIHADTGRTGKLHTERFYPSRVSNPGPS